MSALVATGLRAEVGGHEVLTGVDLAVASGEIHAVMGPNGSGKSSLANVLMGKPGYHVTAGTVTLDGTDLLALATHERAAAGLFLALQDPVEIPGVPFRSVLAEARAHAAGVDAEIAAEAAAIGVPTALVERAVNVDCSGGEKKRLETLQLAVLHPKIAILDELDSGLDIDALRDVARRVASAARSDGIGVLAITHYRRLLDELSPDAVHVYVGGSVVATGDRSLVDEIDRDGYGAFTGAPRAEPPLF